MLERQRCQVVGLNQNYVSPAGTLYHIQIEDRGPVFDALTEREVRRVNVIVYANYGEPNAQIVHGRDHDYPDVRTQDHNRFVEQQIKALAADAKEVIADKEARLVARIKELIREYYVTKNEAVKREFEHANASYPFLFSRAWQELKDEKGKPAAAPPAAAAAPPAAALEAEAEVAVELDVVYPLDTELRDRVIDIERMIVELGEDLQALKARGSADDILLQTCRKLVSRAKDSITGHDATEFNVRRLDMTRNSLMTTWKQVKSRLKAG